MVSFVNLPPEIINYILYDLAPPDLLSCQLANKYLNTTIRDSVLLQHKLALTRACAEDSPLSHLLTTEKLITIKRIEDAWIDMHSDFTTRMHVPLRQSGVYDLTGGLYLLSNADRTSVGLLRLPTKYDDEPEWTMHLVGKLLVDVGLCVYEHDLMVIVTSTVRPGVAGAPNTFDIALEYVEISTRKPHPIAQQSPLFVMNSAWEKPSVGIEIVGKHLVLVLSFSARGHPQDRIFVFNWKTGVTVAGFEARSHTYAALIFLDENHILLPNTRANSLDIFRIPPAPTLAPLRPILVLNLPPLNEGRILGFAPCRAEPNPIGKDSYASMATRQHHVDAGDDYLDLTPDRGFLLKADTALCMFHLRVHVLELNIMPDGGLQMGFPFRYSFTFVTQRQSLLDLAHKHALDDIESVPGPEIPSLPGTTSSNGEAATSDNSSSSSPVTGAPTATQSHATPSLPYDQWGPDITAWFGSNENDVSPMWITTSAGRRCVRMAMSSADNTEGERFFICEFGGESPTKHSPEGDPAGDEKDDGNEPRENDEGKKDKGKGRAEEGGDDGDHGDEPKPGRGQKITSALLSMMAPFLADVVDPPLAGPSGHTEGSTAAHEASGSHIHNDEEDSDADGDMWPGDDATSAYVEWSVADFIGGGGSGGDHGEDEDDIFMDAEDHGAGDENLHDHLLEAGSQNGGEGQPFSPSVTFFYPNVPNGGEGEQNEDGIGAPAPAPAGGENDDAGAGANDELSQDHELGYNEIEIHDNDGEDDDYSEAWTHDPLPDSGEATLYVAGGRELVCPDVFREPVRHNLPYIVRGSRERYRWDGILLDEERVIGIKATDQGHVDEIEILHFG